LTRGKQKTPRRGGKSTRGRKVSMEEQKGDPPQKGVPKNVRKRYSNGASQAKSQKTPDEESKEGTASLLYGGIRDSNKAKKKKGASTEYRKRQLQNFRRKLGTADEKEKESGAALAAQCDSGTPIRGVQTVADTISD